MHNKCYLDSSTNKYKFNTDIIAIKRKKIMKNKPNYGIDAAGVVKGLFVGAIALSLFYWLGFYLLGQNPVVFKICLIASVATCASMIGTAILMILSSWYGKIYQADVMLNKISWKGNEQVLDVGCGRGLLTVKVAQKLMSQGHVTGIDIWSQKDLSGNSLQATIQNIKVAGVTDKVTIQDGDACGIEFEENSFDVVVSNLTIHNIESMENRFVALDEMMRVLKPGGYLLIQDMFCTHEYFEYFSLSDDVEKMILSGFQWKIFPFSRILVVQKK
jgi:arsenite methyltransferase